MSDSSSTPRRAVEKRVKHPQDGAGATSKTKKPHTCKIRLNLPPPIPSLEEEEDLLRIHSPEEHPSGQHKLVNYMKAGQQTIATQRGTPCYESHKVAPDPRFWSYFHVDWYRSIYKLKQNTVVPMQWTDWGLMEEIKDCPAFKDILEMCEYHCLKEIMTFQHNWNGEMIHQFYSTILFSKDNKSITWMSDKTHYSAIIHRFASMLGLSSHLKNPKKFHDERVLGHNEMASTHRICSASHRVLKSWQLGPVGHIYQLRHIL
jgi:hypothetical protein